MCFYIMINFLLMGNDENGNNITVQCNFMNKHDKYMMRLIFLYNDSTSENNNM